MTRNGPVSQRSRLADARTGADPTSPAERDHIDRITDASLDQFPEISRVQTELVRRSGRLFYLVQDKMVECLKPWRLTMSEYGVLNALRTAGEPYEMRPTDLKESLVLTSPVISNILNRLQKVELIERNRDDTDGRSVWVQLTARGIDVAEATIAAWTATLAKLLDPVPIDAVRAASDALRVVLIAMDDVEPPHAQPTRRR